MNDLVNEQFFVDGENANEVMNSIIGNNYSRGMMPIPLEMKYGIFY